MRNLLCLLYFFSGILLLAACSKSGGNSYISTDHTVGMPGSRIWSGTASGYVQGDSVILPPPDVTPVPWPKAFYRTITDSTIPILKIDGFTVSMLGVVFRYGSTDSIIHKDVVYDTLLSGASRSILTYYYAQDSMTFEYHVVSGYNATANQYYQQNWFLHTVAGH